MKNYLVLIILSIISLKCKTISIMKTDVEYKFKVFTLSETEKIQKNKVNHLAINLSSINKLKNTIANFKNLETLIIYEDGYITIPPNNHNIHIHYEIVELTQYLPYDFDKLNSLKELIITRFVNSIPKQVMQIQNLESLTIFYTNITNIEDEINVLKSIPKLKNINLIGSVISKEEINTFKQELPNVEIIVK